MKREITCTTCEGKGKIDLPSFLEETLLFVPKRAPGITADEVHERLNDDGASSPTAQNNRLEKLRALGFVKRKRFGRFWRYSKA